MNLNMRLQRLSALKESRRQIKRGQSGPARCLSLGVRVERQLGAAGLMKMDHKAHLWLPVPGEALCSLLPAPLRAETQHDL